ncbi:MAG: hypothetical protein FIA99_17120, partial [Ruminiclostridium sp.]|nr:hypothetical protein [Ruminiclostridium sp.]
MKNGSVIASEFMRKGKCEICPIIDMHGHYGPYGWIYFPRPYAEDMLRSMDRAGVEAIVCSSHEAIFRDTTRGNNIMKDIIEKYAGRFYGYWAVNPNFPEVIEKDLSNFKQKRGFLGFKFLSDYHQCPITSEKYKTVLEYADKNRLCILMHTWGYSPFDGPQLVRRIAGKYPNVTFIMGHSGYGEWETSIETARLFNNVYLELTAV